MDGQETVRRFGGRITFLAGIDVQYLMPNASADQVRQEIRQMKKLFNVDGKGMLLAMGNGIMPDTPLENIKAALDTSFEEGCKKAAGALLSPGRVTVQPSAELLRSRPFRRA